MPKVVDDLHVRLREAGIDPGVALPACQICGSCQEVVKHLSGQWVLIWCCDVDDTDCCNRDYPYTYRVPKRSK